MKKLFYLIVALIISETAFETVAATNVKVVDGDSLEIGTKRIRLIGIDAPEYFQTCFDTSNKSYPCGEQAKAYLQTLIEKELSGGQKIKCYRENVDRYQRDLSVCKIGKINLNLEMIKGGWAVSYKDDRYEIAQKRAKAKKIGIWQGKFMRPEFYRALKRKNEQQKN